MVFLEWSIGHVSVKSCLVAQQGNLLVLDYRTGHKPRLYVSFVKSFAVLSVDDEDFVACGEDCLNRLLMIEWYV